MTQNILSQEFKNFIRARLVELAALSVFFFAIALLTSLISYSPMDDSLNTVGGTSPQNILGYWGSYVADFLFQFLGLSVFLIPFFLAFWSVKIFLHRPPTFLFLRVLTLIFALILMSTYSQQWFMDQLNFGLISNRGAIGLLLYDQGTSLLQHWALSDLTFYIVVSILLFISFSFLLNLTLTKWVWILAKVGQAMVSIFLSLIGMFTKRKETNVLVSDFAQPKVKARIKSSPKSEKSTPAVPHSPVQYKTDSSYQFPPFDLLAVAEASKMPKMTPQQLRESGVMLAGVLDEFGVKGDMDEISPGPVVTLYQLRPAPGTKSARVIGLADDIARSMSAVSARIAVIPGYNAIGIELPNEKRQMVYFREMLVSKSYQNNTLRLPLALGKNIGGEPVVADLAKMPHLLVAGTTGSGKSVAINTMILSLLFCKTPEQCRFIMIDPKMLELSVYDGIPHLLTPVVTDPHKAILSLKWVVREMESRYQNMAKLGVRNLDGYNQRIQQAQQTDEVLTRKVQTGFDPQTGQAIFEEQELKLEELPQIVVIVDEMADLMLVAGKEIESAVQRLAQMARAAGIHLIMATQRPSVDVITGTIKANFPTRISFQVTSKIDSRTILGEQGAEQLLGQGDMLYMEPGGQVRRVHGPFVSDQEVERVVQYLKSQGNPNYVDDIGKEIEGMGVDGGGLDDQDGDPLYRQALELVLSERKASTSFIQRHLKIGYNRAATIIEQMEQAGVVSAANHVGKREILIEK
jgi:S-DNA-T family DNA segregation ATPase FtsK/SpoIIIE